MQTSKLIGGHVRLLVTALFCLSIQAHAQYVFTTIDDPIAKPLNGETIVTGVSGNIVVGYYFGPYLHGFYHDLSTTNYTTLDEPLGFVNGSSSTEAFGISGNNIVGNYQNYQGNAAGYYGFLYNITSGNYQTLSDPDSITQDTSRTWPTAIDGTNIVGYIADTLSIYDGAIGGFSAQYTGAAFTYGSLFYYPEPEQILENAGYNVTNYATYIYGVSGSNAVGYWEDQNLVNHGIIYNLISGAYTQLVAPNGFGCRLTGIDGDNIVGYYADANYGYNYSGFIYNMTSQTYTASSIHDPLAPGNCFLLGISGNTLVGYYLDNNSYTHGFVATKPVPNMFIGTKGNNLVFSVSGGIPGAKLHLISTGDLALPPSQWSIMSTNTFDTNGMFFYTNKINPTAPATFFGLVETP